MHPAALPAFLRRCPRATQHAAPALTPGNATSAGPPLLLVHGFGVGSFHFERNLEELGREHRVWACDLFGQGASWPAAPPEKRQQLSYSIDTWTDQLAAFIRDVIQDEGGAYIAGNSLGGLLATTVAYRHPEARPLRHLRTCTSAGPAALWW